MPTFTGAAEANASVELFDGAASLGTTAANGSGNWTFTSGVLSEGGHAIKANATDVAGNTGGDSGVLNVTIDTTAPQATGPGVAISGPNADDGEYSIPVGSGDQLKTVPIGAADTIKVTFSEEGAVSQNDLSLFGNVTQTSYGSGTSFAPAATSATWTFGTPLPADKMELTLADTVMDIAGNALDGDWTNPDDIFQATSDTFPTGDGITGRRFCVSLHDSAR